MSDSTEIKTIHTFEGVRGNLVTNKTTGETKFFEIKPDGTNGHLYATMTANVFSPENYFTFAHNVANKGNLTVKEFNSKYFYNGDVGRDPIEYTMKSAVRTNLETSSNFSSPEEQARVRKIAYDNRTWGGVSGDKEINSAGEEVDTQNPEQLTNQKNNTLTAVERNTPEADMPPPPVLPPVPNPERSRRFDASTDDIIRSIEKDGVRKVGGNSGAYYKYPLNLSEQFKSNFDFIQLTAYDYNAPGLDTINVEDYGGERIKEKIWETYQLPMVPGKGESQATDWGKDKANALQLALAGHSGDLINDFSWENIKDVWGEAVGDFKSIIKDEKTQKAITSWFAGQAVGISGLMKRSNGLVINNNMELLFNGPSLRSFNFSWVLTPRSEKESEQIRAIIRSLKRNAAPQRSVSNLFLKTPRVFKVKYIMGPRGDHQSNDLHPYLNKFKTCALTKFNVKYDNGSSNTTYDRGSMTQYTIALTLSELSPIYADEYDENNDLNAPTTGY